MQVVDRRLNPKSKSLGNRQRFLRRAKAEIREAIKDSLKSRKVSEAEGSEKVTIRSKSLREPSFSLGRNTGSRDYVLPGNEEYGVGDFYRTFNVGESVDGTSIAAELKDGVLTVHLSKRAEVRPRRIEVKAG